MLSVVLVMLSVLFSAGLSVLLSVVLSVLLSVSEMKSADDFVGISETPEGLQKQTEKALEYTRK